jgi:hypothetical protein
MFLVSNTAIVKEGMKSGIRLIPALNYASSGFRRHSIALDYVVAFANYSEM